LAPGIIGNFETCLAWLGSDPSPGQRHVTFKIFAAIGSMIEKRLGSPPFHQGRNTRRAPTDLCPSKSLTDSEGSLATASQGDRQGDMHDYWMDFGPERKHVITSRS
jgi:hypothetical protein